MNDLYERMEADLRLRNFQPSTQGHYLRCVQALGKYCRKSPEALDANAVRRYLYYLQNERQLKPSSLRVHVAAFRFLYTVTLDRPKVVGRLRGPKIPRRLPKVLSGSEVEALLESVKSVRYRALLMTIYGAGLRVSEACALKIADIDSKRMLIHVNETKGGGDRFAMLSVRLLIVLRAYYLQCRPPGPYLFPGRRSDAQLSHTTVQQVLLRAAHSCGLNKRVNPHMLRHSFATHLLESGTDIRTIQALLGHRSIQSTQIYVQVSVRHISQVRSPLDLLGTEEGRKFG